MWVRGRDVLEGWVAGDLSLVQLYNIANFISLINYEGNKLIIAVRAKYDLICLWEECCSGEGTVFPAVS